MAKGAGEVVANALVEAAMAAGLVVVIVMDHID